MKMDMHCHVFGGSKDALVSIKKQVELLKGGGYDGMLITDHNSYKALKIIERLKEKESFKNLTKDFCIIVGVEYDTSDAGHVLIILPSNVKSSKIFEKRGMTLKRTIRKVHELGGVIGLAHPYAHGRFGASWFMNGISNTILLGEYMDLLRDLDFIEVYNGTVSENANMEANKLAKELKITEVSGSDSHRSTTVGLCSTIFDRVIETNDDLIDCLRGNHVVGLSCEYSILSKSILFTSVFKGLQFCYYWAVTLRGKIGSKREIN